MSRASGGPRASLFSLSVPWAPVSLCVGPSPPPSLFSDREYDGSEEEDLDVETVFFSESGEFPSEQLPSANPSGQELAHLFGEIVDRATKALNIVLPEKPTVAASRFEAEAEEGLRSEIPLLPDFKDLLCRQFTSPSSYHRWSRKTKVFSNMASQEQSIELQSLPVSAADQLALCPDSSTLNPQRVDFLGFVAACLSRHHMRSSH
ncbi:unnamed protein product [Gadus morhua 'NCC']